MIKITKVEAEFMRQSNYGNFVKKTYSKNPPTYYLVEEREDVYNRYGKLIRLSAMNALEQYRKSRIVKEVNSKNYDKVK